MEKTLRTIFYMLAIGGYITCAFKVYPLVWPTEQIWYGVVVGALAVVVTGTLRDLLELFVGE